jgi:CRP-like cAMP-binding protein
MLHKFLNLFRDISESDFAVISEFLQVKRFREGTVLLERGTVAKELFFVVDGVLKIITTNEKGNNVVHFLVKENKFCTILYSFQQGEISRESILTSIDTELLVLSKHDLEILYKRLSYFEPLIQEITQRTLLDKIQARNALMGQDATARYLQFITQNPDLILRIPLSDVASYLGITQQSLSRIRREIKA